MDTGKYNAHPESKGAPTWTLVSTLHNLETESTYMDTGKYNAPPGSREHLNGLW